jgi:hypothetical protein
VVIRTDTEAVVVNLNIEPVEKRSPDRLTTPTQAWDGSKIGGQIDF